MSQGTKSIYIWNFRLKWDYGNYWESLSESHGHKPEKSYCRLTTGNMASAPITVKMLMTREWKWTKMSTRLGSSPTYLIRSVFAGLLGYRSLFQIMPKLVNVFIFFGHFICKSRKRMGHVNLAQWGWNRASSMSSGHPEQNRLFIIAITGNYTCSALRGSANKSYQSALAAYLSRC